LLTKKGGRSEDIIKTHIKVVVDECQVDEEQDDEEENK